MTFGFIAAHMNFAVFAPYFLVIFEHRSIMESENWLLEWL